jgi:hypothetical protein
MLMVDGSFHFQFTSFRIQNSNLDMLEILIIKIKSRKIRFELHLQFK